jgi:pimeloyl-ACP methyl ester carboxylesterase
LFGSGDNWHSQARALAGARPVLVADMPNHGRSEHVDEMGYPAQAARLWNALDELGYGHKGASVALLGHSMGGKTALGMAFARAESVAQLVVADIATREYPPRHTEIFQAMERVAEATVESRSAADEILAELIPQKPIRLFLLKSLVPGSNGTYHWQLNLDGLRRAYDEIRGWPYTTERFDGPALLIAGGKSPYVTAEEERMFATYAPNLRVETIDDAGHWLHAEARDRFLSILHRELR